jgi:hypothetical protein
MYTPEAPLVMCMVAKATMQFWLTVSAVTLTAGVVGH